MGRRKRRSDSSEERDNSTIANNQLLRHTLYSLLPSIEDRRLYSPERAPRARGLSKLASQVALAPAKPVRSKGHYVPDVFRFNMPNKVAICVRRQKRREVLFALKRTGKGSRVRKRRRNDYSDVSCR